MKVTGVESESQSVSSFTIPPSITDISVINVTVPVGTEEITIITPSGQIIKKVH